VLRAGWAGDAWDGGGGGVSGGGALRRLQEDGIWELRAGFGRGAWDGSARSGAARDWIWGCGIGFRGGGQARDLGKTRTGWRRPAGNREG